MKNLVYFEILYKFRKETQENKNIKILFIRERTDFSISKLQNPNINFYSKFFPRLIIKLYNKPSALGVLC